MFYAKILLFGEYGIIEDSMGLSIPYNYYSGKLSLEKHPDVEYAKKSNNDLRAFLDYLKRLESEGNLPVAMNLSRFEEDLSQGLHFESSIPQGFGVGSSGALVAAVYSRYAIHSIRIEDNSDRNGLLELKKTLATLESYFHGKSSGIDPLICYLNIPILIRSKSELDAVGLPAEQLSGQGAIFLLNTGEPGETQPLVNWFLERCKQEGFRYMLKEQFKKYNDGCIQAFLKGDHKPLFKNLKKLSGLLLEHFKPMIPDAFHNVWKQGIDSGAYYLKLCGSGGGGFILGFTPDLEKARPMLKDYPIEVIHEF